jgi:uncharacterized membrane protein
MEIGKIAMNRKTFILTLLSLSTILSLFRWKRNILKKKEFKSDPVLISLIRKSIPNPKAFVICGIQPMSKPIRLDYFRS